jgi:nicotinamide-nucleotide amidase
MDNTRVEIITIGDEILYGQTLDTNSHWISGEIDKLGFKVIRKTTIGDTESSILKAVQEAGERAQLVLMTGGLGPTNDDLTKPCLAKYFGMDMSFSPDVLEDVTAFLTSKGREVTEPNRKQAIVPVGAKIIRNKNGTAPGMWFEKDGKIYVSMPGVPHEMVEMMTRQVIPDLRAYFQTGLIYHKVVNTVGIGESWLADIIQEWENGLPLHIRLAYLPSSGMVKLRLTATGDNMETMKKDVAQRVETLKPLIEQYIFGYDNVKLEERVGQLLLNQKKTLGLAESCSGGFVSHLITSVPGSSRYFKGSIVSYDNAIKMGWLGVRADTLNEHGAVSEQTVVEMAENARKMLGTDYAISISGIAGTDGGTQEKPVGTVWLALADGQSTITRKVNLGIDRAINIKLSGINALNLLRQRLMEIL